MPDVPPLSSTTEIERHLPGTAQASSQPREGWKDLLLRSFRWPPQRTALSVPATPAHAIVLSRSPETAQVERWVEGDGWRRGRFPPGHITIRPAYRAARWRWDRPAHVLHLNFQPSLLKNTATEVLGVGPGYVKLIPRFVTRDPFIEGAIHALGAELESSGLGEHRYVEELTETLAAHVLREHCIVRSTSPAYRSGLPLTIRERVTGFIQAHLSEDLPLDRLAALTGMSTCHFARCFKESMGSPPRQYVIRKRIEKAKGLLRKTEWPVLQISLEVGYNSQSHFTKMFKRHLGVPPGAYRRQIQP